MAAFINIVINLTRGLSFLFAALNDQSAINNVVVQYDIDDYRSIVDFVVVAVVFGLPLCCK